MSKSLASRRRNTPWLQRYARPIIGAIALVGALLTGYLTATRFFETTAACPTEGCERVLASPYATIFGLPLSLFGLLAYITMAALSLGPLAVNVETNKPLRTKLEQWSWPLMFLLATVMTVFSGYLMYIMVSQFVVPLGAGGLCFYCIGSALFALSFFVLTLLGRDWEDRGQLLFMGAIAAIVALVGTLALYAPITSNQGGGDDAYEIRSASGQVFFTVKNSSGQSELELARHLKQIGARMYSAYWCPHCYEQKELFGKEATRELPYVECASDGVNPQTQKCLDAGIKGFPTWEINGKQESGTKTLQELADWSGYKGPRNFKNSVSGPQ
ncbi:MAG: vitamin K epoxide reductase family protein [Leptolyngbyaceae cyanobacterium]